MSRLLWIALAAAVAVAIFAFVTRRPRDARRRLDFRTLRDAPLDRIAAELRAGRRAEAIELMRTSTGVDSERARQAVESIEGNLPLFEKLGIDAPGD